MLVAIKRFLGLKDDIDQAIKEAADSDLADAFHEFTHRSITHGYDPGAGSGKVSKIVLESTSRGVFDGYTKAELEDATILPTDVNLTVLQSELENIPKVDDEIIRTDNNVNYKIVGRGKDPADVTWILQLRTSAGE